MTTEDSAQAGGRGLRYLGAGFRQEPDFRDGATTFDLVSAPGAAIDNGEATVARRVVEPNLDFVFDDPAEGEPGRDQMLVHGLWELLLVVALAGVSYLLYREQAAAFSGEGLRRLLLGVCVLGLLASASAVALRAAAPNLAVGAVAVAAALYFGQHSGGGLRAPLLVVTGVCAVIGLIQGLVIVGLHVPGWAVSLGVGLVMLIWSNRQVTVSVTDGYNPLPHTFLWFGGFVAVSVLAGVVALVPWVRRTSGRFRPVADPARRRGLIAALVVLGATVISTILSGLAGVLAVSVEGTAGPSDGLELTALALGVALLGGTSAFGRRGGIFGTVLAAGLITMAGQYAEATDQSWPPAALAAGAVALGLVVTRLVERFGRPARATRDEEDEEWMPNVHPSSPGRADASGTSTSSTSTTGLWARDEAWGSTDGR